MERMERVIDVKSNEQIQKEVKDQYYQSSANLFGGSKLKPGSFALVNKWMTSLLDSLDREDDEWGDTLDDYIRQFKRNKHHTHFLKFDPGNPKIIHNLMVVDDSGIKYVYFYGRNYERIPYQVVYDVIHYKPTTIYVNTKSRLGGCYLTFTSRMELCLSRVNLIPTIQVNISRTPPPKYSVYIP